MLLVPGLTVKAYRGTVVDDTAIHRPAPGPVGVQADLVQRFVGVATFLGLVDHGESVDHFLGVVVVLTSGRRSPGAVLIAVQPVAARRHRRRGIARTSLQMNEAVDWFPFLVASAGRSEVFQGITVDFSGNYLRAGFVPIWPIQFEDRLRRYPAFFLIQLLYLGHEVAHYVQVRHSFAGRLDGLVAPLHPSTAVGDGPRLLERGCSR